MLISPLIFWKRPTIISPVVKKNTVRSTMIFMFWYSMRKSEQNRWVVSRFMKATILTKVSYIFYMRITMKRCRQVSDVAEIINVMNEVKIQVGVVKKKFIKLSLIYKKVPSHSRAQLQQHLWCFLTIPWHTKKRSWTCVACILFVLHFLGVHAILITVIVVIKKELILTGLKLLICPREIKS